MQEEDKYWILMSSYFSNELSDTETDELLAWINENPERIELLQQMQNAWDQSKVYLKNEEHQIQTEVAWDKVKNRLFKNKVKTTKIIKIKKYKWLQIAAAIMIMVGLSWFSYHQYQQNRLIHFSNLIEDKQQILLPDSSIVWLNKGGKISYKKGMNQLDLREINLEGEGFFEVKHDVNKPFIVHSGVTITQVLGTSFNISALNDGTVKVAVISGKVAFKKENTSGVLFLLPGDEGYYNNSGIISKTKFKNTNFLYWKNQNLRFENEPLTNVLAQIEKVYGVKFQVKNPCFIKSKNYNQFSISSYL